MRALESPPQGARVRAMFLTQLQNEASGPAEPPDQVQAGEGAGHVVGFLLRLARSVVLKLRSRNHPEELGEGGKETGMNCLRTSSAVPIFCPVSVEVNFCAIPKDTASPVTLVKARHALLLAESLPPSRHSLNVC